MKQKLIEKILYKKMATFEVAKCVQCTRKCHPCIGCA